ncbi:hypothetical protein J1N35_026171 [Gossypium stocksii]|uniref:Ribosomal protein S7 domain-containing protein n=1 Tax=Gossypium stocksii TaxID=47602 RepID=A0A9D3VAA6_9ROSI|nr:hypothetical protein J1N35_026171 [Gossypium stocksii]
MAVRIVKHAMEIIYLLTDQNLIQVIVDAIVNSYAIKKKMKLKELPRPTVDEGYWKK